MKISFPGLIATVVVAGVLGLIWFKYDAFLTQGQKPPQGAQILNKMEKEGVPSFELKDIKGQPLNLSQFAGKVVILNFWASWCEPCVQEFPSLLKLIEHFKGQVVLVAISADYNMEDLNLFLSAFKADSPHLYVAWDKDQFVAQKFGTKALPESYILGQDAELIRKVAGVEDWYTPDSISYFTELLEKKK